MDSIQFIDAIDVDVDAIAAEADVHVALPSQSPQSLSRSRRVGIDAVAVVGVAQSVRCPPPRWSLILFVLIVNVTSFLRKRGCFFT